MSDMTQVQPPIAGDSEGRCNVPPEGWFCTRMPGHDGPCAAYPVQGEQPEPMGLREGLGAILDLSDPNRRIESPRHNLDKVWDVAHGLLASLVSDPPKPAPIASDAAGGLRTALADLRTISGWLDGLSTCPDLNDVVADGGVTVGMVYQQEAREFSARLTRAILALSAPPVHAEPVAWQIYDSEDGWVDFAPTCEAQNNPAVWAKHGWKIRALGVIDHPASGEDVEGLREALKPFLEAAANMDGDEPDKMSLWESPEAMMLTFGDLRRLAALSNRSQS